MPLCENGKSVIKQFYHLVTPELEKIIADVTKITGEIRTLEANPTVEAIVAIIPEGSVYEAAFNKAIDLIDGSAFGVLALSEKIHQWVDGSNSQLVVNAALVKLASVAVSIIDPVKDPVKNELFYDTVTQTSIATAAVNK